MSHTRGLRYIEDWLKGATLGKRNRARAEAARARIQKRKAKRK